MNNIDLFLATRKASGTAIQTNRKYELIESITVSEDEINSISRTAEPDGTAYNFDKIIVKIDVSTASETAANILVKTAGNVSRVTFQDGITANQGGGAHMSYEFDVNEGVRKLIFSSVEASGNPCTLHSRQDCLALSESKVASLNISSGSAAVPFPLNTKIEIFAVRC